MGIFEKLFKKTKQPAAGNSGTFGAMEKRFNKAKKGGRITAFKSQ